MNETKDGGPAFPVVYEHSDATCEQHGLSMRDYFAAMAMQSLRADTEFLLRNDPDQVADRAYEQADAMLKARKA